MTKPLRLDNGGASATILPGRGGLVSSLVLPDRSGGAAETLWMPADFSAGESGWPGGGVPILFPFAGRVFHQGQPFQYELDGVVRHMPIHGFAYGMAWSVVRQAAAEAELELAATEATRALYPFDFKLTAHYLLAPDGLQLTLIARNAGAGRMPVAMGLHPFLREGHDTLVHHAATHVAVTNAGGAGKAAPLAPGPVPLTAPLAANAILADHAQPRAELHGKAGGVALSWDAGYRYVVLWRKEGAGFQCVEPWMGLPDAVSTGAGVSWLAAGATVTATAALRRF